mmetsp:Transcript_32157/g.89582  ORF Transcript_32157/g.89582 Transcript_32157/m.89582 type:complete len:101 (+) Transcript_32157:51-353(+)
MQPEQQFARVTGLLQLAHLSGIPVPHVAQREANPLHCGHLASAAGVEAAAGSSPGSRLPNFSAANLLQALTSDASPKAAALPSTAENPAMMRSASSRSSS